MKPETRYLRLFFGIGTAVVLVVGGSVLLSASVHAQCTSSSSGADDTVVCDGTGPDPVPANGIHTDVGNDSVTVDGENVSEINTGGTGIQTGVAIDTGFAPGDGEDTVNLSDGIALGVGVSDDLGVGVGIQTGDDDDVVNVTNGGVAIGVGVGTGDDADAPSIGVGVGAGVSSGAGHDDVNIEDSAAIGVGVGLDTVGNQPDIGIGIGAGVNGGLDGADITTDNSLALGAGIGTAGGLGVGIEGGLGGPGNNIDVDDSAVIGFGAGGYGGVGYGIEGGLLTSGGNNVDVDNSIVAGVGIGDNFNPSGGLGVGVSGGISGGDNTVDINNSDVIGLGDGSIVGLGFGAVGGINDGNNTVIVQDSSVFGLGGEAFITGELPEVGAGVGVWGGLNTGSNNIVVDNSSVEGVGLGEEIGFGVGVAGGINPDGNTITITDADVVGEGVGDTFSAGIGVSTGFTGAANTLEINGTTFIIGVGDDIGIGVLGGLGNDTVDVNDLTFIVGAGADAAGIATDDGNDVVSINSANVTVECDNGGECDAIHTGDGNDTVNLVWGATIGSFGTPFGWITGGDPDGTNYPPDGDEIFITVKYNPGEEALAAAIEQAIMTQCPDPTLCHISYNGVDYDIREFENLQVMLMAIVQAIIENGGGSGIAALPPGPQVICDSGVTKVFRLENNDQLVFSGFSDENPNGFLVGRLPADELFPGFTASLPGGPNPGWTVVLDTQGIEDLKTTFVYDENGNLIDDRCTYRDLDEFNHDPVTLEHHLPD